MAKILANSTFLEYTSHGTTTATTVAGAYGLTGPAVPATAPINIAFILPRANDPTELLETDWATRQTTLQQLESSGALWSTYGASSSDYAAARALLGAHGTLLGDAAGIDGYISSAESRTVWVSLTPAQFETLFGTPLYRATPEHGVPMDYWNGSLSVPDGLGIEGLWFDTAPWFGIPPAVSDLSGGAVADLEQGPQSIGNHLSIDQRTRVFPGEMADWFYHFPLADTATRTATIGLIEPLIGDALPAEATHTFQEALDAYRQTAGIPTGGDYYIVANNGQSYRGNSGERSLDVGVVASAAPGSRIGLYAGSGTTDHATSNVFTAFQAAFWDTVNQPEVISSSFSILQQTAPGSPFAAAVRELFIDAALRNISVVDANNDWGSSWSFANGLANQAINSSSPYVVWVGGTSLTTLAAAPDDGSLSALYGQAMAGDLATLWQLTQGGLSLLPSAASPSGSLEHTLIEAVWNSFVLTGEHLTPILGASDGGVDTTQPTPWYQSAFGLTPTSANPLHETGRGAPDVSANAGGNMFYRVPGPDMEEMQADDGTSASTPMWASLLAQIDTILHDQGLPQLGYMNDLLYTAAAVAPASFNDITFGNNVTSFIHGDSITNAKGESITLTGFGYHAAPGYDLTTGLGSPNGTLLARALTAIGHSQMWFGDEPGVIDSDGHGGWQSGADQSLLFQTMSGGATRVGVTTGPDAFGFASTASDTFAWTSRLAQQTLQPDFDPQLVRLFDKQAQGWVAQEAVSAGETLSVSIGSSATQAIQETLTSSLGFADFLSSDGAVRVARAVAVAETAGGQDDQTAIVRLRQNGQDSLTLSFYRVDDLSGTIDGLQPGAAGYAAAAQARAYHATTGATAIDGPGYGNYAQASLSHVNAGDLIAMQLTNNSSGDTYWAFAQANETADGRSVGHLWNYGLNTWGWEDLHGGGDRDFNDLVVQLDFTSASGMGWLV